MQLEALNKCTDSQMKSDWLGWGTPVTFMLPGELGAHMFGFPLAPINLSYINLLGGFTSTILASEAPRIIFKGTPVPFCWNAGSREGFYIKNEKLNQTAAAYSLK